MIMFKIAYRNLWRNKRRTQLTMGAMIFACTLLIFSLGYYDGMLWNLINNATEKENGHIVISRKGYMDTPSINKSFAIDEFKKEFNIPLPSAIKGICPRASVFALLSCGPEGKSKTQPAEILGIDYSAEKKLSKLENCIVQGNFLTGKNREIVLGVGLAKRIDATIGDEIILVSNGADGSIASEILVLCGLVNTGEELRDANLAIMNLSEVQELFCLDNKIHSLRIFLNDPMSADEISKKLRQSLENLEVTSWKQTFPQISSLLGMWFGMQVFTMIIYYAALAMITFNTMYMAFLERIHEFAVMRAIGLTRGRLAAMILGESCIIAAISGLIGTILGVTLNFVFFYYPFSFSKWMNNISWGGSVMEVRLFCVPSWMNTLLPFVSMLILGMVVAALPAIRLHRLNPVEALREA
ncbi:MAG: ABC transporter permease [Candidatus Rifleibacteriota bacterium]